MRVYNYQLLAEFTVVNKSCTDRQVIMHKLPNRGLKTE